MFQKQKMVLVCLPDSVAQLLVKAAQFILFEPGNGFRSCMKYFCESLFVCQLVHKFCPLVFIIPYRSHCLRRNLCLSVFVKILYISFHELLENSLCLRSHERFVHDVKTDDRLAVCVPLGQHPPHIDVMILNTGSIFGWWIGPEVVEWFLYGRTDQIGVAPDLSRCMRQGFVKRSPFRSTVSEFSSEQILMHIQNKIDTVFFCPTDSPVNFLEIAFIVLSRFRFQAVPVDAIADAVDSPVAELFEKLFIIRIDISVLRRFGYVVDPVENEFSAEWIHQYFIPDRSESGCWSFLNWPGTSCSPKNTEQSCSYSPIILFHVHRSFFIVYATKISQRNCMNDFIFIYLPYKINEWFNLESAIWRKRSSAGLPANQVERSSLTNKKTLRLSGRQSESLLITDKDQLIRSVYILRKLP